jgi:hypothetical protein
LLLEAAASQAGWRRIVKIPIFAARTGGATIGKDADHKIPTVAEEEGVYR